MRSGRRPRAGRLPVPPPRSARRFAAACRPVDASTGAIELHRPAPNRTSDALLVPVVAIAVFVQIRSVAFAYCVATDVGVKSSRKWRTAPSAGCSGFRKRIRPVPNHAVKTIDTEQIEYRDGFRSTVRYGHHVEFEYAFERRHEHLFEYRFRRE